MLTKTVKITVPSDIIIALNDTEEELANDIKFSMAIKYYQMAKLTIGQAARLAGYTRYEFERLLGKNKIPISNLTVEDAKQDIKVLKEIFG